MHLCDYSKAGNLLPSSLPIELQPQRSRTSSAIQSPPLTLADSSLNLIPGADSSPTLTNKQMLNSFEDKRRENFDRGNAVLEAKRQMLREQEEREKREREEKERIENEKKQKLKEEQEKRRLAELEKQMERQRLLDMQREEERKKLYEQREKARNELIRQQRIEWEKQKKQELEVQKLKLQEQLSSLKAKDKNLEYDMQVLNEKISSHKIKIADGQGNLNEFNSKLEFTRKSNAIKQSEVENTEKEFREFSTALDRLAQEKYHLNEELKSLNQDSPFAEEYRKESTLLKTKEASVQKLKMDLEKLEQQINSARTQLEMAKHELEVTKSEESDLIKENDRLAKLIDQKRNNLVFNSNRKSIDNLMNKTASNPTLFKTSQSNSNIQRAETPKGNY